MQIFSASSVKIRLHLYKALNSGYQLFQQELKKSMYLSLGCAGSSLLVGVFSAKLRRAGHTVLLLLWSTGSGGAQASAAVASGL